MTYKELKTAEDKEKEIEYIDNLIKYADDQAEKYSKYSVYCTFCKGMGAFLTGYKNTLL